MHGDGSGPTVSLVGTAPPRRCGDYAYSPDVVFEIRSGELGDYRDAAAFVDAGDLFGVDRMVQGYLDVYRSVLRR